MASLDLVGQRVAVPLGAATVAPLLAVVGNVLSPQANQISSIGVGSITVRHKEIQCPNALRWALRAFSCKCIAAQWST